MVNYPVISADTHIIEPPDLYVDRINPKFRERAPRVIRCTTDTGQVYDAWFLDGSQRRDVGNFVRAGQRFDGVYESDSLGIWEDVTEAAYDPHQMITALAEDGIWGACFQPSQGLVWYRIDDSQLLSAICRAYNNWIADFCEPFPTRLKGIGCLNVDDVEEACTELERGAKLGLVGFFIPVYPLPNQRYSHPIYERLWWTAEELHLPLLLHIGTNRAGIPGCEVSLNPSDLTAAGRASLDQWVRYSLTDMIFTGVFDRHPKLLIGSVEHELAWITHWLNQMDFIYRERPRLRRGWLSREGLLPSDYWRRNMFAEFMEDDTGIQHHKMIGLENMLWGNDFPHQESTWPKSMQLLDRIFLDMPVEARYKITSENATRIFKFEV